MTGPEISIAVPVRNEVERLPHLLAALTRQTHARPFTLALFFDGCEDGSQELVAAVAPDLPFAVVTACCERRGPANAGLARCRAMALAASIASNGVLMTTDADSQPAPGWVAANLDGLTHADIVAGRIVIESEAGAPVQARLSAYYDRLHRLRRQLDPVEYEAAETHHWTSAASLAMRGSVYAAVGGFEPIANGEDAAFADTAARLGFRLRRDAAAWVRTSARRAGRAGGGFAAQLALLDAADRLPLVAHPEDEAWRYAMHAAARRAHGSGSHARLAEVLSLPLQEVTDVAAGCPNGEAFAARIVSAPPCGMRDVTLAHAELLLDSIGQDRLEGAA